MCWFYVVVGWSYDLQGLHVQHQAFILQPGAAQETAHCHLFIATGSRDTCRNVSDGHRIYPASHFAFASGLDLTEWCSMQKRTIGSPPGV